MPDHIFIIMIKMIPSILMTSIFWCLLDISFTQVFSSLGLSQIGRE